MLEFLGQQRTTSISIPMDIDNGPIIIDQKNKVFNTIHRNIHTTKGVNCAMMMRRISMNENKYAYIFLEHEEDIDVVKINQTHSHEAVVIIRNGVYPCKETIVNAIQYIADNPLTKKRIDQ